LTGNPTIFTRGVIFDEDKGVLSGVIEPDDVPIKEIESIDIVSSGALGMPVVFCHGSKTPMVRRKFVGRFRSVVLIKAPFILCSAMLCMNWAVIQIQKIR
jgi:hypothetical protein